MSLVQVFFYLAGADLSPEVFQASPVQLFLYLAGPDLSSEVSPMSPVLLPFPQTSCKFDSSIFSWHVDIVLATTLKTTLWYKKEALKELSHGIWDLKQLVALKLIIWIGGKWATGQWTYYFMTGCPNFATSRWLIKYHIACRVPLQPITSFWVENMKRLSC